MGVAASWQSAGTTPLAVLLAAIGGGSALFHLRATAATQLADIIPIGVFQLTYAGGYLRRAMGRSRTVALAWLLLFVAALLVTAQLPQRLNGSLAYLPAALALVMIGLAHYRVASSARERLLDAAALFALALALRTVDHALCAQWPSGTHWAWQVLNALVLYLAIAGLDDRLVNRLRASS